MRIDHTAQPLINADSSNLSWYTGSGRVLVYLRMTVILER